MPPGRQARFLRSEVFRLLQRRDSLEGFWKAQFCRTHGVLLADAFYELVARHKGGKLRPDEKPEDLILEFRPQSMDQMLTVCLWSHWTGPGEPDLYSFAALTDEPPNEVAATGHDRCIIPLRQERFDEWLNPERAATFLGTAGMANSSSSPL